MHTLLRSLGAVVSFALVLAACGDAADVGPTARGGDLATVPPTTETTAPSYAPDAEEGPVDEDPNRSLPPGLELNPTPTVRPVSPVDVEIGAVEPALLPAAERAREDLAGRVGADPASIEIVTAEFVVWPDSSLGCPHPDMSYLQVLTDGVRILLVHEGATFAYHGGGNRDPFLCEQPAKPLQGTAPGGGGGDS